MTDSKHQKSKVDFYEPEYTETYDIKPSFYKSNKPLIAGIILLVTGIPSFFVMVYTFFDYLFNYSNEFLGMKILMCIIGIISLIIIITAGICAINKIRHRFTLFGAIIAIILPFNMVSMDATIPFLTKIGLFGIIIYITIILIPFITFYLVFTSDDEFIS